jgi:uncharacterized protein YjbJ (UPF0337 family)
MLSKEEIKGKARQVLGAIKENLGWLTDDHIAEGEGKSGRNLQGQKLQRIKIPPFEDYI